MAAKKEAFSIAKNIDPEMWSKLDTQAPKIELIDIDAIECNDSNFYELSNLQPLADSILMDGLQQPLVVMTSPTDPSKVKLLSGHRRRASIQMLVEDAKAPHPELRLIPCIRKTYASEAMAELQLILANSTARVLTPAETMKQAEKTEMLLYQLKEEGFTFPGRMRDQVAAACNASASKLARLKVIRDRLEPEFMEAFKENKLSEDSAYHIAKGVDSDGQRIIIAGRNEGKAPLGLDIPTNVADHIIDGLSKLASKPILDCPGGGKCTAGPARQRSITRAKNPWESFCTGCCLDCNSYSRDHCSSICPAGKEKAKLAVDRERKQQEKQQKEAEACNAKNAKKAKAFANKLLSIAGDTKESRKKLGEISYQWTGEYLRKALNGENTYSGYEKPSLWDAEKLANEFGVSLDYIYGRSDEPVLYKGEWKKASEEQPNDGEYVFVLKKTEAVELSVYRHGNFMDATERSQGNISFNNVEYWAHTPRLPDGKTFPGQTIIEKLVRGEKV